MVYEKCISGTENDKIKKDKHHVLRSINLHLYLEYERITTTSDDSFTMAQRPLVSQSLLIIEDA
jgi:hypothetical protein